MSITLPIIFLTILVFATSPIKASDNYNDQIKCGSCPCNTTCNTAPPPPTPSPPPPSPPPPPPSLPPPSPPKVPTPTPGQNCPPPPPPPSPSPSSGFGLAPPAYIYTIPPPGDLYPVISSGGDRSFLGVLRLMVVFGLMGLLICY